MGRLVHQTGYLPIWNYPDMLIKAFLTYGYTKTPAAISTTAVNARTLVGSGSKPVFGRAGIYAELISIDGCDILFH